MSRDQVDWVRLQKALSIEADRGFTDLMGKEKRFSEFITEALENPPVALSPIDRRRWQHIAGQFGNYSQITAEERESLIRESRLFLLQMQRVCLRYESQQE